MATKQDQSKKTNYVAYQSSKSGRPRIGHLDLETKEITPLSYSSGTPLSNLHEVIEAGESIIIPSGNESVSLSDVYILPPISGRDILAVGKNYSEHAKEFNKSGYDASDKVDQPTHPVIFTKRSTSIIAHGEEIYPHPDFIDTTDYEGEIGVIIGKPGYQISEKDAMNHVWGYTIINDVTARTQQRDHKQFYIGKSPDTFCPIGPVAVAKEHLPDVLKIETHVNGEKRQAGTTEDLIFNIPTLVKTISAAQTLQIGDTIATGTPAGVGFGFDPPKWLKPGDEVTITVTGLGTLSNKIADPQTINATTAKVKAQTSIPVSNSEKSLFNNTSLTTLPGGKPLFYTHRGNATGKPIFFIHGLGGSSDYFTLFTGPNSPLSQSSLHLHDFEGHGLSPTSATSILSIDSLAKDLDSLIANAGLSPSSAGVTLVAHSMGCLVALSYAIANPNAVSNLVLMGPPPSPLPEPGAKGMHARALTVRSGGMAAVVDAVVNAGLSQTTHASNPLAVTATRITIAAQVPEGYAKACTALANTQNMELELGKVKARTLIVTGSEDKVSSPEVCKKYQEKLSGCGEEDMIVVDGVGHWHLFENTDKLVDIVSSFLG